MIATNFDPLFWRAIVIGAIVAVFVVGAVAVQAMAAAGRKLGRRERTAGDMASGSRDARGIGAPNSPALRATTANTAGNDAALPPPFHKEAA
jgi:hypothetical protein